MPKITAPTTTQLLAARCAFVQAGQVDEVARIDALLFDRSFVASLENAEAWLSAGECCGETPKEDAVYVVTTSTVSDDGLQDLDAEDIMNLSLHVSSAHATLEGAIAAARLAVLEDVVDVQTTGDEESDRDAIRDAEAEVAALAFEPVSTAAHSTLGLQWWEAHSENLDLAVRITRLVVKP